MKKKDRIKKKWDNKNSKAFFNTIFYGRRIPNVLRKKARKVQ